MKAVLFCLFLSNQIVFNPAFSQNCPCHALMPVALQPRGPQKIIGEDSFLKKVQKVINLEDIYHWQNYYEKRTNTISWNPKSRNSERRSGTPEDSIYVLKGYMWFVHKIGFDCDYHIEIGDKSGEATRIIVEVPYSYQKIQKQIKDHLDSLELPLLGCSEKNESKAHFTKGLPVLIFGYGFYDSFHKMNKNHGDHHTNKYLWEIHPVTGIIFLEDN